MEKAKKNDHLACISEDFVWGSPGMTFGRGHNDMRLMHYPAGLSPGRHKSVSVFATSTYWCHIRKTQVIREGLEKDGASRPLESGPSEPTR